MYKPRTTYYRLTDWLLVLAIALAPLQGAYSAFDNTCEPESRLIAADTGSHATTGDMTGHEHFSNGSSTQDCSQQECYCSGCAGVCNLVHAPPFLPSCNQMFFCSSYNTYEPQDTTLYIGRAVSTLFRPPRTSV